MDIQSLIGSWGGSRRQTEIEREAKRPTNSRDTPDDISAIDGAAVPSVSGSVRSFDEDSVGAAIIGSDAHGFVKEAMKMFDANSFVVAASSHMNVNVEDGADFVEETFESAAVID
jgi:hypothetical protein